MSKGHHSFVRTFPVYVLAISMLFTSWGCATNRRSTLATMAGAFAVGGTIGALKAPKDESQLAHAAMWGGISAAVAGVIGLFVFDEEKHSRDLQRQNDKIQNELNDLKQKSEPQLVVGGENPFGKSLPKQISGILRAGEWKLYKTDRWVEDGENRLIHNDRIFEYNPPALNPNIKSGN